MRIPKKCDVVIIGGGPGGSTAGALLAKQGFDVVLFEKAKHPRYNVGESVIPQVWKYTDLVGATDKIEEEGFIAKAGGTASWNGVIRQMSFKDFGYTRPALHVERDRFDYLLLDNSREKGVQVFEEITVLGAEFNGEVSAKVQYRISRDKTRGEISCRFVIDASGQGAVIAKQLGIRMIDESFRFISFWGYYEDSKYVGPDGKAHSHKDLTTTPPTTFVTNVSDWGWVWHIPMRCETSVGFVVPQQHIKKIKTTEGDLEGYFRRTCGEVPVLNQLLEDATFREGSFRVIRDYSYRPKQVSGPGFFLIGDAAAFVDPIFSVGVAIAMYSASTAAWAIERTLKDSSRAETFRGFYDKNLLNRLEVARSLALPRYGAIEETSDQAKSAIQHETALEQELMFVASTMTTRNENFKGLVENRDGESVTSSKYRVLDKIEF